MPGLWRRSRAVRSWGGRPQTVVPRLWLRVRVRLVQAVTAQRRYSRLFATWLDASSAQPLTPEERETLAAADADLDVALATGNPRSLERWGGLNPCCRLAISLRRRADPAADGVPIESYSTRNPHALP